MSTLPRGSTVRRDAGLYGYERALRRAGLAPIAGVDEAGRGACAGPLVAAAAILPEGKAGQVPGLADSKLLTAKARERCYAQVLRRALAWSVVVIQPSECDRLGMHVANVEALRRSLARLELRPAYVLTDGFPVDGLEVPGLAMWKGDRVAACISAAVGDREGDARPDHVRAARAVPGVRLRHAQGLHHRGALGGADRARSQPGAPDEVRERTACRRDHRPPNPSVWSPSSSCSSPRSPPRNPRHPAGGLPMSAEDLEKYETEMELNLYREYRDVVGIFKYVVETDRRFYLCNQVDVKARTEAGDVFFEVTLTDAWVWDMYRPARRLAKNVKVLTFKDVNVEELSHSEIEPPKA